MDRLFRCILLPSSGVASSNVYIYVLSTIWKINKTDVIVVLHGLKLQGNIIGLTIWTKSSSSSSCLCSNKRPWFSLRLGGSWIVVPKQVLSEWVKDRRPMVRSCSPNISLVINLSVKNGWVCCCMQISRPGRQAGTEALLLLCFPSPPSSPLLQREQTARWYMGHQVSTEWCMESGYEESTFTAWRTCTHDRWRILPNVVQLLVVVTSDDIISICASKCYRCLVA